MMEDSNGSYVDVDSVEFERLLKEAGYHLDRKTKKWIKEEE
jgi:hypothetical protein